MCLITNMTDHKRVEIKTENETPALNAREYYNMNQDYPMLQRLPF